MQLFGLLDVVEPFTVAVPGVDVGPSDGLAVLVDDPTGDEHRCARYAVGDVGPVAGGRTALDVEGAEQSRVGGR